MKSPRKLQSEGLMAEISLI